MTEWKDNGVILKIGHFHEADLWLKMLLRHHGLVTVFAFGGARSKKRFCGCLDLLNTLNCRIKLSRTREYHVLEEASLVGGTRKLRENWQNMGLMANCVKFVEAVAISPDAASESYQLVCEMRDTLENRAPLLANFFFRLKLAAILGYKADFHVCSQCGRYWPEEGSFMPAEGHLLCSACARYKSWQKKRISVPVSAAALECLDFIQKSMPSAWPADNLSPLAMRQCGQVIDAFVQYHLGLEFQDGFFRNV